MRNDRDRWSNEIFARMGHEKVIKCCQQKGWNRISDSAYCVVRSGDDVQTVVNGINYLGGNMIRMGENILQSYFLQN